VSFVVSFHCRRRWSKCCCPCRWGLLAPVYPMLTVGARAASQGVAGGKQKTRDVARCGELDDLVFEGFGGAICCGRSTDPSCHSYDPALSMSLSIPFSDEPPRPLSSPAACSISFAELVKGSLNPTSNSTYYTNDSTRIPPCFVKHKRYSQRDDNSSEKRWVVFPSGQSANPCPVRCRTTFCPPLQSFSKLALELTAKE